MLAQEVSLLHDQISTYALEKVPATATTE